VRLRFGVLGFRWVGIRLKRIRDYQTADELCCAGAGGGGFELGEFDRGFCEVLGDVGADGGIGFALEFLVVEGEADTTALEGCWVDRVAGGIRH
jgi:hypothetical protein